MVLFAYPSPFPTYQPTVHGMDSAGDRCTHDPHRIWKIHRGTGVSCASEVQILRGCSSPALWRSRSNCIWKYRSDAHVFPVRLTFDHSFAADRSLRHVRALDQRANEIYPISVAPPSTELVIMMGAARHAVGSIAGSIVAWLPDVSSRVATVLADHVDVLNRAYIFTDGLNR